MYNISVDTRPRTLPPLLSLPFQLGLLSVGLFFLTAFGSEVITRNASLFIVGLKISFWDLFIVALVFFVLLMLAC